MAIHHRQRANLDAPLLGETIYRTNSSGMASGAYRKLRNPNGKLGWGLALVAVFALVSTLIFLYPESVPSVHGRQWQRQLQQEEAPSPPVLVSYSYFEKDAIQVRRALQVALRLGEAQPAGSA